MCVSKAVSAYSAYLKKPFYLLFILWQFSQQRNVRFETMRACAYIADQMLSWYKSLTSVELC